MLYVYHSMKQYSVYCTYSLVFHQKYLYGLCAEKTSCSDCHSNPGQRYTRVTRSVHITWTMIAFLHSPHARLKVFFCTFQLVASHPVNEAGYCEFIVLFLMSLWRDHMHIVLHMYTVYTFIYIYILMYTHLNLPQHASREVGN